MATSPEAFNQVRDILKKLDRSIDSARDRRLHTEEQGPDPADRIGGGRPGGGEGSAAPATNGHPVEHRHATPERSNGLIGGSNSARESRGGEPETPGKARPLRARPMSPRPFDPADRWNTPGQ